MYCSNRVKQVEFFLIVALFLSFSINLKKSIAEEKPLLWIGLYNSEMIAWLENENCLQNKNCEEELCPGSLSIEERKECEIKNLKPRSWELSVLDVPSNDGKKIGNLIITSIPGKGIKAAFKPTNSSDSISFQPDLFDEDWGYGPYFHQTVLEWKKEGWFLLPKNPLPFPAWINLLEISQEIDSHIISIEIGQVYQFDDKSIVILDITKTGLLIRLEQPSDMWCEEGDPPPLTPSKPKELKYDNIFDKDGHLKLKIKYKRGC